VLDGNGIPQRHPGKRLLEVGTRDLVIGSVSVDTSAQFNIMKSSASDLRELRAGVSLKPAPHYVNRGSIRSVGHVAILVPR